MSAPLVSVVTPVYNGARYLRECVESVLGQTYPSFEYLIVDNCSTDATLDIARGYEQRDACIRVIAETEFVPTGNANANRAFRRISGDSKYVKVLHADDGLFPECLARMVALAERDPSIGIVSAYRLEGDEVTLTGLSPSISLLPGRDVGRSHLLAGPYPYLFGSPSSVLLRADLVRERHEFYNLENPFQGDQEACLELLQRCDLGFVHEVLTFTRRHDEADSSFFVRVHAGVPLRLRQLLRYGPAYLTRGEYQRKLAVRLAEYGLLLASRPGRLRDAEFRAYHRAAIATLLPQIGAADLCRGIARQLVREGRKLRAVARTS